MLTSISHALQRVASAPGINYASPLIRPSRHSLDTVQFSGQVPPTTFSAPELLTAKVDTPEFNKVKQQVVATLKAGFGDSLFEDNALGARLVYENSPKDLKMDFIKLKMSKHFEKTLAFLKATPESEEANKDDIALTESLMKAKEADIDKLALYVGNYVAPQQMIDNPIMQSGPANKIMVIRTNKNEIAAIGVMMEDLATGSNEIATIQFLTVLPPYRQQGLAGQLKQALLDEAKRSGITHVYTINTLSPKSYHANINRYGFKPLDLKQPASTYPSELKPLHEFIVRTFGENTERVSYKVLDDKKAA